MSTILKSDTEKIKEEFDRIIEILPKSSSEDIFHLTCSDIFFSHVVHIDYRNADKINVSLCLGMENENESKFEVKSVTIYEGNNKEFAKEVYNNIAIGMNLLKARTDKDGTPQYEGAWTWEPDNN